MDLPRFVRDYSVSAEALPVKEPVFSRGSYQLQVDDQFPFIVLSDEGALLDSFCTCDVGSECVHLAAGYLYLMQGNTPLHVRFGNSFWKLLCEAIAEQCDYQLPKREGNRYLIQKGKKNLIVLTAGAKHLIEERSEEHEENSLKFSHLSKEELTAWREKRPGALLAFELSFFSDLAKEFFFRPPQIRFIGEGLPSEVELKSSGFTTRCLLSQSLWPHILPGLTQVSSPLPVFESPEKPEGYYDESRRKIVLESVKKGTKRKGVELGSWIFVPGEGFYREASGELLPSIIEEKKIGEALTQFAGHFSLNVPIQTLSASVRYRLYFDEQHNLHIELFVLEPGDCRDIKTALFPPWIYQPGRGFTHLTDLMFPDIETVIVKDKVGEFISRHRVFLQHYPAFRTHLGSLESRLNYELADSLRFGAELEGLYKGEEAIDYGEWIYLKGEGFYMKRALPGRLPIHPGLVVEEKEIGHFIQERREELEPIQGFFRSDSPIIRMGLEVGLTEEKQILVKPRYEWAPGVDPTRVRFFGDFVYYQGFSEIPPASRLPEKFQQEVLLTHEQEGAFLIYDLEPLKKHILFLDTQLKRPEKLELKIRKLSPSRKSGEYLADLYYESELGEVDFFTVWEAVQGKKRHLFSGAGLLTFGDPRFSWVRQFPKRNLDRKKEATRLNALEWIRLSVYEQPKIPSHADPETKTLFSQIGNFEPRRKSDASLLQATLRPYQNIGLEWLFRLYTHGLSGLLCDDMGLGKTLQAMALLASVAKEDPDRDYKYLVVCPTSVIYHWQELFKRFLPHLRVMTYYGLERTLEPFDSDYDLLLTSYGIIRSNRQELKAISFEVAIFDEIQIAKNDTSQTHKALKTIDARFLLGLTGTPIENRLKELKALFDLVLPNYMPPEAIFRDLFIHPIEKNRDEEKKALLSKLVSPFILRRKKGDVLQDLPEKVEELAYCDLSKEQWDLYRHYAQEAGRHLYHELKDSNRPVPYIHIFSTLSTLKQICDHPALYLKTPQAFEKHSSGKWELFLELLAEARGSGQKVVVFSQYLDMLAICEGYLKAKGIRYACIKGSTKDRADQLRRFKEDPTCEVFLASLLAAGVGIDLTAASVVIHYDRWWNPAKENQATDRVHRIGQSRGVQVFKLIAKETIEEHIHQLIEKKKALLEDLISSEDADSLSTLSRDELLTVFEKLLIKTSND
jgi:SNF2 family DNA or RNA helicase